MTQRTHTQEQELAIGVFRRVIEEGFNHGNLAALDDLFTPGSREHQRGFPAPDLAGLKRGIQALGRAIPDFRLEIEDVIFEGDRACFRLVGRGHHQGQFGPVPGSGKPVTVGVIDISRFQDSRIAEHWGIADRMGVMEQVGMPEPPRWLMKLMMKRKR
jgi:predicted SnoaL-like aldol condensation-catalyzing enzyme